MNCTPDPSFRHPLTDAVLAALAERPTHDATTLVIALSGATLVEGSRRGMSANRAYWIVAMDVLGCMEQDGLLQKGDDGLYRKVGDGAHLQASE